MKYGRYARKIRAAGPWQLMPTTERELRLKIYHLTLEPVQLFISGPNFLAIGEGPDTRFTSVCSSCGGRANWNPHVHALITDTCWDREGNSQPMPEIGPADIHGVEKLFAGLVFKMPLEEDMISEELVDNMNSWKHSGFSVYSAQPIEACDDNARKTLIEYISRVPFSLERMSFNEGSDTVLYRGEHL